MATSVANNGGLIRRFIKAVEPWYDWGTTYIERIEAPGEGPGRFFTIQWLGLSLTVFYGRTPKRDAR
jgi:hypothetical protein